MNSRYAHPQRLLLLATLAVCQLVLGGKALAIGVVSELVVGSPQAERIDLPLTTQHGDTVRFFTDVLQGRMVVIHTIYTNCLGSCHLMTRKLAEVRAGLTPETRKRLLFVSISIDPERDSPENLREFAKRFDLPQENWLLLTGNKQDIDSVVQQLGYKVTHYREHSSLLLAGNVPARQWSRIAPHLPPRAIASRIEQIVGDR